jgi:hypothetical protein
MGAVHWGTQDDDCLALCGSWGGTKRTTLRLLTCEYCLSRIDRFLHENLEALQAANKPQGES